MRQVLGPGALGRPRGVGWRGLLHFYMNLRKTLSISAKKKKKGSWDFDRDFVESIDQFREIFLPQNIKSSNP